MKIKNDFYIFFAATPLNLICINELRKAKNINNFKLILICKICRFQKKENKIADLHSQKKYLVKCQQIIVRHQDGI